MRIWTPVLLFLAMFCLTAAEVSSDGEEVLRRLFEAQKGLNEAPKVVSMKVKIDATLPALDGSMQEAHYVGLRTVGSDGAVNFEMESIEGADVVKRYVIGRYLTAEMEASKSHKVSLGIDRKNYKFEYKGLQTQFDRQYHVFELEPRKKAQGLFRGELWLDPETYLPRREYGLLVKTPSVLLSDVYFVRDYWILNGQNVLRRMISDIDVRLYGRAHLEIWMEDHEFAGAQTAAASLVKQQKLDNGAGSAAPHPRWSPLFRRFSYNHPMFSREVNTVLSAGFSLPQILRLSR